MKCMKAVKFFLTQINTQIFDGIFQTGYTGFTCLPTFLPTYIPLFTALPVNA